MTLKEYLDTYHVKISLFAKDMGMQPRTLYQIMKGKPFLASTGQKIVEATEGRVTMEDLLKMRS